MKRTILVLLVMLIITKLYPQDDKAFITLVADPKMLIEGPYDYNNETGLDITFKLSSPWNYNVNEAGIFLNSFHSIRYYSYGFFYYFKIKMMDDKFNILIGPEARFIIRKWNEATVQYMSASGHASITYYFTDNLGLISGLDLVLRPDLSVYYNEKNAYRYNGFIGLKYRIK